MRVYLVENKKKSEKKIIHVNVYIYNYKIPINLAVHSLFKYFPKIIQPKNCKTKKNEKINRIYMYIFVFYRAKPKKSVKRSFQSCSQCDGPLLCGR